MQAERHGGPGGMAAWLEERERQLRALEAENREMRRQLDELRHGIGIALMIEGRLVPLAPTAVVRGPTGPTPAPSTASPAAAPAPRLWPPHLAPASDPQHAAGQALHPFAPLAETPDQLPAVSPLAPSRPATNPPQPVASPAWPDPPTLLLNNAPRPGVVADPARSQVRRATSPSHPLWRAGDRQPKERNPYADSFLL
jgi:hypothetical protein